MRASVSIRFYRLLLRLYPRDFRSSYGARMEEAFLVSLERRAPGAGLAGVLACWARVTWDTVVHASALRLRRPLQGPGPSAAGESDVAEDRERRSFGAALSTIGLDFRFTVRTLKKGPGLAVVAVLVAGVGTSVAGLALTVVNAAFLRPLPHVRSPDELVMIGREHPSAPGRPRRVSYQDWLFLREQSTTLREVAGGIPYRNLLLRTRSNRDRQVIGGEVTENYFQALGIPMVLGRGILPEDADAGTDVAVLGHATWMREFGGNRDALGQIVRIDGHRYTVVGVAPPGLGFLTGEPVESAVWIPIRSRFREAYDYNALTIAGRRREQTTISQVQAELDALIAALVEADPQRWVEDAGTVGLTARTDRQARLDLVGGPRGVASIIVYLVFIGLIMIITCSNVANLLLNRALKRRTEIAMRLALGAGRGRVVRQLLTESILLFAVAGVLALLLLHWGTRLLAAGWGSSLPAVATITLDIRVVAVAFGITLLSGLAFGLVPALQATRPDLVPALRGTGEGGRFKRFGARNLLVLAQVTASMVLVAVSGLIVRDIQRAEAIDIGFETRRVAVASFDLAHGNYGEEEGRRWLATLTERLENLPQVEDVAFASWVPLSGSRWTSRILPEGIEPAPRQPLYAVYNAVTPGYFGMVEMPLLAGRDFTDADEADAPLVIIVNQSFARRYWPDRDPIGMTVALGEEGPEAEVVGMVGDAMYGMTDLRNGEAEPHIWTAAAQAFHDQVVVHVRFRGTLASTLAALQAEIRLLDEDLPIREVTSMESLTDNTLLEMRAAAMLFGGFGALALLLAALGIYGVMAHAVLERTREMGVRLAVGARPGKVVGMVLADSLKLSAAGIAIGAILAVPVGLAIRSLLVGVSVLDPWYLSASVAVLVTAAATAGLAPAIRAARTDPLLSLKSE